MVVGWPQTQGAADPTGFATRGILAGSDGAGMLVLDMRTAPGASGAPVFNADVEVVGIMDQVGLDSGLFAYAVALTVGMSDSALP